MEGSRDILDRGEEVQIHCLWTDLRHGVESRGEKDESDNDWPHLACFLTRISGLKVENEDFQEASVALKAIRSRTGRFLRLEVRI